MIWLASMAARKTAELGEKVVSTEEWDAAESPSAAADARRYVNAYDIFVEYRDPQSKLSLTTLQPKPTVIDD